MNKSAILNTQPILNATVHTECQSKTVPPYTMPVQNGGTLLIPDSGIQYSSIPDSAILNILPKPKQVLGECQLQDSVST